MKSRKQILKERLIWVAAFLFGLLIYLGLIPSTAFIRRRYGLETSGAGDGTGGMGWASPEELLAGEHGFPEGGRASAPA